jgi:formylglycine-generating enzyme required for sulfatase activity
VTAPVTGATPVTTAIDTVQYTGTISWSPTVSGTFAAFMEYTATIVLTPKPGFTMNGVAANSFTVAGATVTHGASSGAVAAVFPSTAATTITLLSIPGVIAPVIDATPVITAIDTAQYTGTINWSPTVSGTFAASTVYTANIVLTPKTGFTLTGVAANSFTVAGATVIHSANSGEVAAVFPATLFSLTMINIAAIPGVPAPVLGGTPVTAITATAQYTGTVTWSGSPATFAASTVYTASITLTAKAGFTLTGVAENSFTVAGATATNTVNSGLVTAVFPVTLFSLTMINVPAGSFQRDATATNISTISTAYRMSQYEITRAQFAALLTTDPSNTTYSSGTSDPVQMTNWYHAIAFCNKLSLAEGLTPVYEVAGVDFSILSYASIPTMDNTNWSAATATWTANGYRLPTEMEWMWAAMGAIGTGTNTTGYLKAFAGSTGHNAIGNYAVYDYYGTGIGRTTTERSNPVGSKLPNELGLYDMSGNVWEWCWDWYAGDPAGTLVSDAVDGSGRGAASGTYRVDRGGSWGDGASSCTVASRSSYNPGSRRYDGIGFRVVRP